MKLMTLKQYKKMSKTALMRKITKTLRAMPKAKLALLCYNLTKAKVPRLRVRKNSTLTPTQRAMAWANKDLSLKSLKEYERHKALPNRKAKRKFSAKQLAAQRLFAKRAKAGTLRRRR